MSRKILTSVLALLLATVFAACGSEVSAKRYAQPNETISAAKELGATENPQASLYLKMAEDQVARADKLIDDGEEDEARRMLSRADSDAALALSYAKLENTRERAKRAESQIRELQREVNETYSN